MKRFLLCLFAMTVMCSCEAIESEIEDFIKDLITLPSDKRTVSFDSVDVSETISFSSNSDWSVSISGNPSWLTVSPMRGTTGNTKITITPDDNLTTEARSAQITIAAGESKERISVSQKPSEPTLSLSKSSLNATAAEGSVTFKISSNIEWEVGDIPSWITITPMSGDGSMNIKINYDKNTETTPRSAKIKFANSEYSKEAELTITQEEAEEKEPEFVATLSLGKSSQSVTATSGSFTIDLTSNVDWTTSGAPSWVTLTPASGTGDKSINVTYTENTETTPRSAKIKFANSEYSKEAEFTISQEEAEEKEPEFVATLSLGKSSQSVTEESGSFTIDLTSNVDWTTSGVPSWVTLTPASGTGDKNIKVSYTENTETTPRSAKIKFANSEYSKEAEFTITQEEAEEKEPEFVATLSLGKSSQSVTATSGSFTIDVTSNIDWTITGTPAWITLDATSGTGDKKIKATYTANTTKSNRTATLKFSADDYDDSASVAVSQDFVQLDDLVEEEL